MQKLSPHAQKLLLRHTKRALHSTHECMFEGAKRYLYTLNESRQRGRRLYGGSDLQVSPLLSPSGLGVTSFKLCSIQSLREAVQWGLRVMPVKVVPEEKGKPVLTSKPVTMFLISWSIPDAFATLSIKSAPVVGAFEASESELQGGGSSMHVGSPSAFRTPAPPAAVMQPQSPGSTSPKPPVRDIAEDATLGKVDEEWLQWYRRWYVADNGVTLGILGVLENASSASFKPSTILSPECMPVRPQAFPWQQRHVQHSSDMHADARWQARKQPLHPLRLRYIHCRLQGPVTLTDHMTAYCTVRCGHDPDVCMCACARSSSATWCSRVWGWHSVPRTPCSP